MAKQQMTVRLEPEQMDWLGRFEPMMDKSTQLREDLTTLQGFIRETERGLTGRFTEGEACLICDVMNGYHMSPAPISSLRSILMGEVADGIELSGLDQKWGVSRREIMTKLDGLTGPEAFVVFHWAHLFWADESLDLKSVPKIFRTKG